MIENLSSDVSENNLKSQKYPENWKIFLEFENGDIVTHGPCATLPAVLREILVIDRRHKSITIKSIRLENDID